MIDDEWQPPTPQDCLILSQPILVENVLGIWLGETFSIIPIQIGMVVSNQLALKNTVL